jgi:hypothetical protein
LCTAYWGAVGAAIGFTSASTLMGIVGAIGLIIGGKSTS